MKNLISIMPRIYKTAVLSDIDLLDVFRVIQSGNYNGEDLVNATNIIRSNQDENQLRETKKNMLPAVMFNGTFSYKNSGCLKTYSNVTAMDFDNFATEQDLCAICRRLTITPCVLAVYRTPSGRGLKAIVMHDNQDPQHHQELYSQLLEKFNINTSDHSVSDLARGNYICYDPNIWVNGNCQPYHFEHDPNYVTTARLQSSAISGNMIADVVALKLQLSHKVVQGKKSDQSIISILNSKWRKDADRWRVGNRANSVFYSASELCRCGVDIDKALEYMLDAYTQTGLLEDEIRYQALRGYQNNAEDYGINRSRFDDYGSSRR